MNVPHGCGRSPTTEVAIQLPDSIHSVTPTRNANYTLEIVSETLDEPIEDSHGAQVTERTSQVIYTALTPLPSDQRDAFELSLRIPEEAAGETLYFPTVTTCEEGEDAWVQIAAEGDDPHALDYPAPSLEVAADSPAASDGGSDQTPLVIGALIAGVAGLATGIVALLRTRRS